MIQIQFDHIFFSIFIANKYMNGLLALVSIAQSLFCEHMYTQFTCIGSYRHEWGEGVIVVSLD